MKIMVCYDGSEAAESALKLAKEHAEIFKTGIFNIADLSVTTGMIMILLMSFKNK